MPRGFRGLRGSDDRSCTVCSQRLCSQQVRRDNCALVRNVIETCLKKILIDRSTESAIAYGSANIIPNDWPVDILRTSHAISAPIAANRIGVLYY